MNLCYCEKCAQIFGVRNLRLIEDEERRWTDENVDAVALKNFPNINREAALCRPILFSNWLSKDYIPVERERLREYVKARLKVGHFVLVSGYKLVHVQTQA